MPIADPEQEKRRLSEFYAGQMDGELEKVAAEAYELTEIARGALLAEIPKRGLNVNLAEHPPVIIPKKKAEPQVSFPPPNDPPSKESHEGGEFEHRNMVTIRKFRDLPEALLAKGSLDSAGIECILVDENMVRLDWFISNLLGGVKLQVNAEDAAEAEAVLSQPIPEDFDVSGIGTYEQPHCPKCGSLDINFRETAPAAYLSTAFSVPIPFRRRAWRCQACDVEWEDEADTGEDSEA